MPASLGMFSVLVALSVLCWCPPSCVASLEEDWHRITHRTAAFHVENQVGVVTLTCACGWLAPAT